MEYEVGKIASNFSRRSTESLHRGKALYQHRPTLAHNTLFYMARPRRFERPTPAFGGQYSNPAELRARGLGLYLMPYSMPYYYALGQQRQRAV